MIRILFYFASVSAQSANNIAQPVFCTDQDFLEVCDQGAIFGKSACCGFLTAKAGGQYKRVCESYGNSNQNSQEEFSCSPPYPF